MAGRPIAREMAETDAPAATAVGVMLGCHALNRGKPLLLLLLGLLSWWPSSALAVDAEEVVLARLAQTPLCKKARRRM